MKTNKLWFKTQNRKLLTLLVSFPTLLTMPLLLLTFLPKKVTMIISTVSVS